MVKDVLLNVESIEFDKVSQEEFYKTFWCKMFLDYWTNLGHFLFWFLGVWHIVNKTSVEIGVGGDSLWSVYFEEEYFNLTYNRSVITNTSFSLVEPEPLLVSDSLCQYVNHYFLFINRSSLVREGVSGIRNATFM